MKKIFISTLAMLFVASVLFNVWQIGIRHPLSPKSGRSINSQREGREAGKTSFRVATYNIKRCYGMDGIGSCRRTASVLKEFDLIALNEVGGGSFFTRDNQAQELGRLLDMGWLFLPNQQRYYQEHFGNGLLSSLDISYWYREQLEFDVQKSHTHRNLTTVEFDFDGEPATLLLTHLDLGEIHEAQLAYVIEKFNQHERCILLGDLNALGTNPQLKDLLAKKNVVDAIGAALGPNDIRRVDWIIVKGFTVKTGGYTPVGISDHPLFWVELAPD